MKETFHNYFFFPPTSIKRERIGGREVVIQKMKVGSQIRVCRTRMMNVGHARSKEVNPFLRQDTGVRHGKGSGLNDI